MKSEFCGATYKKTKLSLEIWCSFELVIVCYMWILHFQRGLPLGHMWKLWAKWSQVLLNLNLTVHFYLLFLFPKGAHSEVISKSCKKCTALLVKYLLVYVYVQTNFLCLVGCTRLNNRKITLDELHTGFALCLIRLQKITHNSLAVLMMQSLRKRCFHTNFETLPANNVFPYPPISIFHPYSYII